MKTTISIFLILAIGLFQSLSAQENMKSSRAKEFPFSESNWNIENTDGSTAEIKISEFKGRQALELQASQIAYLKNKKYKNFVIEFDCNGLSGPGFGFRVQNKKNYEYLYLRLGLSGKRDALQYVPIHNGNLPWQLYNYPKYEGKAVFPRETVATFPISFKKELVQGKASAKVISRLAEVGLLFSKESEVALGEDVNYIYDPQGPKALLFEERDNAVVFLDIRSWIHVKVEVMDDRASFYVEDMKTPALVVEDLKRDVAEGVISLISDGAGVYFANVSVRETKSNQIFKEDSAKEKSSSSYLTKWNISEMFIKDSINFVSQVDSLFEHKAKFKTIQADSDGLINISRFYDDMTRTVAMSCIVESDSNKTVKLNFDYADHLVILLNSNVLFDKGMDFQPPADKGAEGRVFVDDENVELDLIKGKNRLIFLLSGDSRQKFNWGFIAKLENMDGVSIEL